jgi:hypothetical protein
MSRYYTDDPAADADRYYADQEQEFDALPFCDECHQRITDDILYEFNDELICGACVVQNHRKHTEDYME